MKWLCLMDLSPSSLPVALAIHALFSARPYMARETYKERKVHDVGVKFSFVVDTLRVTRIAFN